MGTSATCDALNIGMIPLFFKENYLAPMGGEMVVSRPPQHYLNRESLRA